MKKLLMSALAISAVVCVTAQDQTFKPFKVDISLGYAIPGGSGSKGGVLFVIEPKYALNDKIAVGLRMEAAVVARVSGTNAAGEFENGEIKAASSYLATGDYYFNTNPFRPFAGAGIGVFTVASASNNNGNEAAGAGSKFGGMVRGGFETGHFRAAVEYNLVGSSDLPGFNSNGTPTTVKSKNGYIGIKIGFLIGGGRL